MTKRKFIFEATPVHENISCHYQPNRGPSRGTGYGISLLLLALLFFAFNSNLPAKETPNLTKKKIVVPEKIAGVKTITAEQLIESLGSDNPTLLIDARLREDRNHGHIEGSVSLPDIETNCESLKKINETKDKHMTFYCNGMQCGRSVVSIKVARSCGYHNLSWFKGGFAEWKQKGYQYITKR